MATTPSCCPLCTNGLTLASNATPPFVDESDVPDPDACANGDTECDGPVAMRGLDDSGDMGGEGLPEGRDPAGLTVAEEWVPDEEAVDDLGGDLSCIR